MRGRAGLVVAITALAALLVVTGCGGSSSSSAPAPDSPSASASASASASRPSASGIGRYVALGDSYTAAPYVYLTDIARGCIRSNGNYPSLLAQRLRVKTFVDVSCSAATTLDIRRPQRTAAGNAVPAQIRAVTGDTDLVTLGIGGNDNGLFASLVGGCLGGTSSAGCGRVDLAAAPKKLTGLRQRVAGVLRDIEQRAPKATVVLVGYPRLVQPGRRCSLVPLPAASLPTADRLTRLLDAALRGAARDARATYVSLYAASKGHDICAGKQAWINGPTLDQERAAPFHPFAVEQRAVAGMVAKAVG